VAHLHTRWRGSELRRADGNFRQPHVHEKRTQKVWRKLERLMWIYCSTSLWHVWPVWEHDKHVTAGSAQMVIESAFVLVNSWPISFWVIKHLAHTYSASTSDVSGAIQRDKSLTGNWFPVLFPAFSQRRARAASDTKDKWICICRVSTKTKKLLIELFMYLSADCVV